MLFKNSRGASKTGRRASPTAGTFDTVVCATRRESGSAVRELAYEDLSDRLQAHLKQVFEGTRKPDPVVMDEIEKFMRPMLTDENTLLVGLETFYRLGRWASCMRWGRALYRREVRPIRRGLGAWREFRCRLAKEPELVSASRAA